MIKKVLALFSLFILLSFADGKAQEVIKHSNWEIVLSKEGHVEHILMKHDKLQDSIPFFKEGKYKGPSFYVVDKDGAETVGSWQKVNKVTYATNVAGIECTLKYLVDIETPTIEIVLTNRNSYPFQPQKSGLKLGIDTYMDKYPEWFFKYFPTLMYCDRTHFYGYLQTPTRHTLGLFSEQPIASWSVDYSLGYMDPSPHWFMGHRIESLNLDLLNELPLPDHNPQHLYELKQGESKTWNISFVNIGSLNNYEPEMRKHTDIPLISIEQTDVRPNEKTSFSVFANNPIAFIYDDKGKSLDVELIRLSSKEFKVTTTLPKVGLYNVEIKDRGKVASATLLARNEWKWVLEKARLATIKYPQKATSHAESWYGFYSAFIAAKEFPNQALDLENSKRFDMLYNLLHEDEKPLYYGSRIQNTSTTIGLLVDKYEAFGDVKDLEKASKLGDWLIETSQHKNGAYYNHSVVYTSEE